MKTIRSVELEYFCDNFKQIVKQYKDKWICIKGENIISSGNSPKEALDICREMGIKRPFITRAVEGWGETK